MVFRLVSFMPCRDAGRMTARERRLPSVKSGYSNRGFNAAGMFT